MPKKKIAALLGIVALLGVVLLVLDASLKEYAPTHEAALIAFIIVDLVLAGTVYTKPTKMVYGLVAAWSILRIVIQIGDIMLAPSLGFGYADFANYLFNPLNMNVGGDNPPGVPGAVLDRIVVLQIVTAYLAWRARKPA